MTGLCWTRRLAAIKYPKTNAREPAMPTWRNMAFETDSDPVLIPIRVSGLENTRSSLIFGSMSYTSDNATQDNRDDAIKRDIDKAAPDIVNKTQGDVLPFVPTVCFGALVTADRNEIDGFRKIAEAIEGYLNNKNREPLSITVFGQPGSGKSFGVKQVIRTILKSHTFSELEFNLSQFGSCQTSKRHLRRSVINQCQASCPSYSSTNSI